MQVSVASGQVVKHAISGYFVIRPHVRCTSRVAGGTAGLQPLAVVTEPVAGGVLAVIFVRGLYVNLSASAPRGLPHSPELPRRAWAVDDEPARRSHARLSRSGPCVDGVQPVLKPIVTVASDVVETGP
jgi:hypothetical protein